MKSLVVIALSFFFTMSIATAAEKPMQKVAKSLIQTYKLPAGFTSVSVQVPLVSGTKLANRLNELTRKKLKDWRKLVLKSGEYDHLTAEKRAFALKEPAQFLEVPYLIEIQEVKAIYQGDKLVGYVFETADHVQAAIYQDGAGIHFYTDEKLNVVAENEWSA